MATPKDANQHIPFLADQKIPNIAGAFARGVSVQFKQITQSGVAPLVVDLAAEGLSAMADSAYAVMVDGEAAGVFEIDQSTIDENGFSVLGGADTEVCHIVIVGRLKGQLA